MPDYSKCIIYKLCCRDLNIKELYVGSTCNFTKRKYGHKSDCGNEKSKNYNFKVYNFMRENGGWINWDMIMVEEFSCENKLQKLQRERYWYEELKATLNCDCPGRTGKEYREANKNEINEKKKEYYEKNKEELALQKHNYYEKNKEEIALQKHNYYEKNKEEIALQKHNYYEKNKEEIEEKAKQKIQCKVCNCKVRRDHIAKHNKTAKHKTNLEQQKQAEKQG